MDPARSGRKGKIILATVEGDIHEIGKNVLGMILSAAGWEVIDLGVNVPASAIIDAVNTSDSRLIGLSVLLTTMIGAINEVVCGSSEAGLRENGESPLAVPVVLNGWLTKWASMPTVKPRLKVPESSNGSAVHFPNPTSESAEKPR